MSSRGHKILQLLKNKVDVQSNIHQHHGGNASSNVKTNESPKFRSSVEDTQVGSLETNKENILLDTKFSSASVPVNECNGEVASVSPCYAENATSVFTFNVIGNDLILEDPVESHYFFTPTNIIDTPHLVQREFTNDIKKNLFQETISDGFDVVPIANNNSNILEPSTPEVTPPKVTIIDSSISCSDESNSACEYKINSSDESYDSSESNNSNRPRKRKRLVSYTSSNSNYEMNPFIHETPEAEVENIETLNENNNYNGNDDNLKKIGRKRMKNPERWKRNITKEKTQTGQEHSTKSGRVIKKRVMKEGCEKNCKKNCKQILDQEKRKAIFNKFWGMACYNRQSAFVGCCVKRVPKKRIKVKNDNSPSRKKSSLCYSLPIQSTERVEVCKKMFLDTLAITDMWVSTALKKIDTSTTGTVTPDKRGTHSNRPFHISLDVKEGIREHINLFPKIPSHYCRERTSKMYLEDGLNVSRMYRLYTDWAQQKCITIATERQYRDVLNSEFNIGFFKPKKDRCERCVEFELKTEKPAEFVESYEKHLERKRTVRKLKENDKQRAMTSSKVCVSCFDLQKVIQIPQSHTSVFYYKLKLSAFNFTVFDLVAKEGFCYIWHEQIAKRGSNEISSCLYKFLIYRIKQGYQEFVFYSDNCVGQNKNKIIVTMYYWIAKKYNVSVCHRFLEPGHTQNENDSIHAVIEKKKKEMELFTPDQFIQLVKMAKVTGKPYKVNEMGQDSFFDFKKLCDNFKTYLKDSENKKILWNDIKEIKIDKENPEIISLKYDLLSEPVFLHLVKKNTRFSRSESDLALIKCYNAKIPLSQKKYEHLQYLKNKVPETYRYFYDSLTVCDKVGSDNESE